MKLTVIHCWKSLSCFVMKSCFSFHQLLLFEKAFYPYVDPMLFFYFHFYFLLCFFSYKKSLHNAHRGKMKSRNVMKSKVKYSFSLDNLPHTVSYPVVVVSASVFFSCRINISCGLWSDEMASTKRKHKHMG